MSANDEVIRELGTALGLFSEAGSFDSGWLRDPVQRLKAILTNATQREALGEFLDAVIPGPAGTRSGYHPLLFTGEPPGPPRFGNLYLVFEPDGADTLISVAGEFHTSGAPFELVLSLKVPLLRAHGSELRAAMGDSDPAPLEVAVGLVFAPSAGEVRINELRASVGLYFDSGVRAVPRVEIKGFRLGGAPARDFELDAEAFESGAVDLVLGLLHDAVANAPEPLRSHLLPTFGLDAALPVLPVAEIVRNPAALRNWFVALSDAHQLGTWFGHLVGLFGGAGPAGTGTYADPFRSALLSTPIEIALTLGESDGRVYPGVRVRVGSATSVHLAADLIVLGAPLRGGDVELLPELSVSVRSPTPLLAPVVGDGGVTIVAAGGARAGFILANGEPRPLLELSDVVLAGQRHPRIDLTHLDAVGALASDAVEALLISALGDGPGRHLLALAGVVTPTATEPGDVWSLPSRPRLDFVRFLSDPLGALGRFHRDALMQNGWPALLRELGSLLGISVPSLAAHAGSLSDPWPITLAASGPISVRVVAFRSGEAHLHLGLEVELSEGAFRVALLTELFSADLPATGEATLALFQEHHASIGIEPVPKATLLPGTSIHAARLALGVRWLLGSLPQAEGVLEGVVLSEGGSSLPAFDIGFPFPATPPPIGDAVLRLIVQRAAARFAGEAGINLLAVLGVTRNALALPADFPLLSGDLGSPIALLRPWLRRVLTETSAEGARFAEAWLRAVSGVATGATLRPPSVTGSGTAADPWRARIVREWPAELTAWLVPPVVTARMSSSVEHAADGPEALAAAIIALRPVDASLLEACGAKDEARLASGFRILSEFFAQSDGVVPVASQAPSGVSIAATVTATHETATTAATAALTAEIGSSVALLVSAPFNDRGAYASVIGASGSAHFDFRQPGVPFDRVDLRGVTGSFGFYTADLAGTNLSDLVAQLERVIDHLDTLRPGVPIVLVGHSLSGVAAARVSATRAARLSKVVTIAAPLLGAVPPYVDEDTVGAALRVASPLLGRMPSSTSRSAVTLVSAAVSGTANTGAVAAIPLPSFASLGETAVPSVPTRAIVATVGTGLVDAVATALQGLLPTPAEPALEVGIAVSLDPDDADTDLRVRTKLELSLGRIGLSSASSDARLRELAVDVRLARSNGFLLGGPGTQFDGAPWPARIGQAHFRAVWNGTTLTTSVSLVDAALTGALRQLSLADAETALLLDALFTALETAPEAARLLTALRSVGMLLPDAPRLYSDALAALRSDGAAYLAPRLRTALNAELYGFVPGVGVTLGPIRLRVNGNALELDATLPVARAQLSLDVPSLALSGEASASLAGATLSWRPGALDLAVAPWLPRTRIFPVAAALPSDLPLRILFSTAADALLSTLLPGGIGAPLDALLSGRVPVDALSAGLNAANIAFVLQQLGTALGMPQREGLFIQPAGLLLSAVATADGRTELNLSTETPLGGVLGISAGVRLGGDRAPEPIALLTLQVPDPPAGAPAGAWRGVGIQFGIDTSGIALALVVGATRVTFLPEFSGWASLLGGGLALLPHALDEITQRLPASPVKTAVLDVAEAFGLFGPDFSSHTADFQALTDLRFDATTRGRILGALAALLSALGLPGSTARTGSLLTWTSPALPPPTSGTASVSVDWTEELPAVGVSGAIAIVVTTGSGSALERVALQLGVDALLGAAFHALVSVGLDAPLGTAVVPKLEIGARQGTSAPEPVIRLLPLATSSEAGPLQIELLPAPLANVDDEELPGALGFGVLLPLLSALLERATGSTTLWPGGPTLPHLVNSSGLFDSQHRLVDPPPDVPTVLGNIAAAMSIEITLGSLHLTLGQVAAAGHIGVAASGHIPIPIDSVELDLIFGNPSGGPSERTSVTVFRKVSGSFELAPLVSANYFGVGVRGSQGRALISTDNVRLGGAEAFTYFDVGVEGGSVDAEFRGAGVAIEDLGISLGAATGGNNAIASGLMKSTSSGDGAPAQPGFGISVAYKRGAAPEGGGPSSAPFALEVALHGTNPRVAWLGIHAAFGPLYIDQIGVELEDIRDPEWIRFLVDGGVNVAGFAAQVDDLSVQIPVRNTDDASLWGVDLAGLGVAYSGGGINLLGGLVKRPQPSGVEYAGMLQLRFGSLGAVAVGAWAKIREGDEEFDSLFVFAAVFVTISFAPYFELQALGAGFGYNRALIVPEDINEIPGFTLIQVLDDPSAVEHPMELLETLRMPARKGTFWFAAGIRGALFVVVDVIAVVYVALDKNLEIGLVGVGRLAQPKGSPIVSIELAVKARYSSAEGVLSIQAQLTDNSWLLIRECQLTGGFALFIWFPKGKFVLTIGGYHPSFEPEPEFPIVPRLGFRCNLLGVIQIKGESYFALTNSCVMAGTRLEAAYDIGWLRAWFRAWADFLLSWDPFHYDISIGIELGADFNIEIDLLFGTIRVHFSVSVGASLWLVGPPLHGEVHASLGPISITVPFGDSTPPRPPLLTWPQFRDRYVLGGDPTTIPVSLQIDSGLTPPASGAQPPQGTSQADAWRLVPEFSLSSTTAMAASNYEGPAHASAPVAGVDIDLAPMGVTDVTATHRITLSRLDGPLGTLDPDRFVSELQLGDFAEAVWHYTESPNPGTNNVKALAGVKITAIAEAINKSAAVPILTLVDTGVPLPLPFAAHTSSWRDATVIVGAAANTATTRLGAGDVSRLLVSGSPARTNAADAMGFGKQGISGSGLRSLRARKSPPVVAPLSEGLDLTAVGRGLADVAQRHTPVAKARSTKLLGAALQPIAGLKTPLLATRATKAQGLMRRSPPKPTAAHGKLLRMPAESPQTTLAAGPQLLLRGPRARKHVQALENRVLKDAVQLPAGSVQHWQLAAGRFALELAGDAARVVALGRGGVALLDLETSGERRLTLPPKTETLVLWSLGKARHDRDRQDGLGSVTLFEAPQSPIAVGWHVETSVQQVSALGAVARGSRLRWSVPIPIASGFERAGRLLSAQSTVETWLPAAVSAVLVIGDVVDPTAARLDDLELASSGAELGEPIVFHAEMGEAAMYPVSAKTDFSVSVSSVDAFRLKGVLGFRGRPDELATLLHGQSLSELSCDGPIGSEGSISFSLRGEGQ
ncbi:MAG: DUF6603 domain-containing protein [Myxococcota bacterium]